MKNLYRYLVILLFAIVGYNTDVQASHIAGGNFSYQCVGQDSMLITLALWRDCNGISAPTNVTVTFTNSCGTSFTQGLTLQPGGGPNGSNQVSDVCINLLDSTSCGSGTWPGMEMYIYQDVVAFPPSCNGEITATAGGGASGFSYTWPNGRTGPSQDGLCAGRYVLTVTDNNGCTATDTVALFDPSLLNLTTTPTQISCNGVCDGSITVAASGGAAPYTYSWSNGGSGATQSNLCPGQYSVTVMDDNGNQFREYITLDNPSPIFISFTSADETCAGLSDGSVRADVTGGTAPYTYTWTGGLTGPTNANVAPGTYTLNITDANNCTGTATVTVNAATALTVTAATTNPILCNGNCNGELTATPAGGSAPYTYLWSDGSTNAVNSNLCGGSYDVTVTDANGCSANTTVTLAQPNAIVITPTVVDATCGAACNGSITLGVSGGTGAITYTWGGITPNPGNVSTAVNLCAGVYSVTATDASGCTSAIEVAVKNTGATATTVVTHPSCAGICDGTITVTPTSGTAPYTYNWSNGNTTNATSSLCAGDYSVTVTDNGGCMYVETIQILDPDTIAPTATVTQPSCVTTCDGSVSLAPTGGAGSYNILWSNGATTTAINNLCAGTYTVTITDGNACQKVDSFIIANPTMVVALNINNAPGCSGVCDGEIEASVTGGTAPYTYAWSSGGTLGTEYDLCGGLYSVTVTDANGCSVTGSVTLTTPTPITTNINTITSPNCSGTWEMGYSTCCRNSAITNIQNPGGQGIYASATFNAAFEPPGCNSGVQFFNNFNSSIQNGCQYVSSLTYGCPNQYDCYVFLQTEPDGDSVHYSLIAPLTSATASANYVAPYTVANPVNGILDFDSINGTLCYSVPNPGFYAFTMQADEYDPVTGLYLGTSYRDIQLVILSNCDSNYTPYPLNDSIYNFTTNTNAQLTDTNEITLCEGADFCFDVTFIDSNLVDTNLCLNTNATELLVGPGPNDTATVTITAVDTLIANGDSVLRISATTCWTAPAASQGSYIVKFSCSDDHCPSPTVGELTMKVNVVGSTTVSPDVTICGSQSAQLNAYGGTTFGWRAIAGDSVIVGVNFSCDSCTSPIASPTQTTTYEVTSDLVGSCKYRDTVTVTVAQDYQVVAAPDTILCTLDSIQMSATPSIPGTFTYQWSPTASLSNGTIANPLASPSQTTIYNVTATSVDGCVKNASATVTITPLFPPLSIVASDTLLCDGDSADLEIILGNTTPTSCGLSPDPCYGTSSTGSVGTGLASNTSFGWPAPFGGLRNSARHQMLIRATELTAAGFSAGLITGIALDVATINGTTNYDNFTVGMTCTANSALGFAWTPTTQVVPPTNVTLNTGWNWLSFPTPFMWDGTSNIIVETCFDNTGSTTTQNTSTRYTTTAFISVIYYQNFTNFACNNPGITSGSFNRPNINFEFCAPASPGAYTYQWNPNVAITDTSVHDPSVFPPATTTYEAIVFDTFGVCQDTADITIYKAEIDAGNDTTVCPFDTVQFNPTISQSCTSGTPVYSWSPTTGLSNPNVLNPVATVNQTRTYYLTYTDPCGCILTDSLTVFVNQLDTPTAIITPPTCGLSDGSYVVQAVGGNAPFEFSIDSGATFQVDSNFINLPQGIYELMVKDSLGCVSPVLVDTLVNPGAPQIDTIYTTDLSCYAAQDGVIEIIATGGTQPLEYSVDSGLTWHPDSLFLHMNGGQYDIFVRDASGCVTFPENVTLFPIAELEIDSVHFKDLECYNDNTGEITIFGSGGTAPIVYSIDNGVTFFSSNHFDSLAAGNYLLTLRDSKNCVITSQLQVINEPLAIDIDLDVFNDTCFNACGGKAEAMINGGTPPFSYAWLTNTTPQNAAGIDSLVSGNLCPGSYIFQVTDSNNCIHDSTFVVTTPDPLLIDSLPFTNISCNGDSDGSFTIHISGGTKPYNYSTDGGTNYTQTFLDSIYIDNLAAGTYSVVVSDSNFRCTTTSSVTLIEPTPVDITIPFSSRTVCVSNCLNLSAAGSGGNGAPFIYHWSEAGMDSTSTQNYCPTQDPSQDATIVVFVEDSRGCRSGFESFVISLYDSLEVTGIANDGVCPGESVELAITSSGGDGNGFRYQWTPSSTLSDPFAANPTASPLATTQYVVKLQDNCGSPAAYDTVEVEVHPLPTIAFTGEDTLEGCEPFDVTLINQSTPAQFCFWTVGNDVTAQGFSADITDLQEGVYDVNLRVRTPHGCESDATVSDYLIVHPKPSANFEFGPQPTTLFDPKIQFKDLSSSNVIDWQWDFAGLGASTETNPSYVFPSDDSGSYDVELMVTSDMNCTNEVTYTVQIGAESNLFIPNSFTPNGDGLNDVFAPIGLGIVPSEYSMVIYDRWGNLIYETTSLTRPWDGRIMNSTKMASNGSYVWKITANDETNENNKYDLTGYINLIR